MNLRVQPKALLRWVLIVAAAYAAGLAAWQWMQGFYLVLLTRCLNALRPLHALPQAAQVVFVPARGLAIVGASTQALTIPQQILGADVALSAALVLGALWLPWQHRVLRMILAAGLVFVAHMATIMGQAWVNTTTSNGAWATWNLWTTLYQGKVVPLAISVFLIALPISDSSSAISDRTNRVG